MTITIEKKYIAIPINNHAVSKKLCFWEEAPDRELVMDFDCKLDAVKPQYVSYIDVSRYRGKTLICDSVPHMEFTLTQCDEKALDGLYREEYRPMVHFTPQIGWLNDPNGMICYHGVYHMFYQYNPCGTEWGNMHWGHAVSRDLLHWEEKDIALFPDEMGTMYSGSAIEDLGNVTGLGTGETGPMLLFYTAAGDRTLLSAGKCRTQCLAYSNDGGETFVKYRGNPILGKVESYNRDPKIVWVEEIGKYLMALYLAEDRYGLFTSENLLDWSLLQELRIANESECPDLYCFRLSGKSYWVLIGASDKYLVGVFKGGRFVPQTQERQLCYSPFNYAGQSFSGMQDGRVIRMTWEKLKMPCVRVPNQMSIPMEMKLRAGEMGCYLTAYPIAEISQLYADTQELVGQRLEAPIELPLERAAYDIRLITEYGAGMTLELFGHTLRIDTQENCVAFGKLRIPISGDRERVDIRVIADSCSLEVFADEGRFYATLYAVCDYNLPYLRLTAQENGTLLKTLTCHRLASIHGEVENV
ncbi:MAG TPA: hypothetical protein DDW30_01170 [Clostridiales bacterium]|nr:hypothetical protein [Clostridiales bacterium]